MTLKERIVAQTTAMFSRHGIKSIRMDDIASELGISKRTIYETFGDKEALITECLEYHHDRTEEMIEKTTADATNIIEEFILLLKDWDTLVDNNNMVMSDLKKYYPKIHRKLSEKYYEHGMEKLKDKLQKGIDDGLLLPQLNLSLSLSVFTYSMYGIFDEDTIVPYNVSQKEAFRYVTVYFLRGIATDKGIKLIDQFIAINKR